MKKVAALILIYAFLLLIGGGMGYLVKKSLPSLIAGSSFALLFCINGFWLLFSKKLKPLYCTLILSFVLDGFFTYRLIKTGAFFPSGAMCLLTLALLFTLVLQLKKLVKEIGKA